MRIIKNFATVFPRFLFELQDPGDRDDEEDTGIAAARIAGRILCCRDDPLQGGLILDDAEERAVMQFL